MINKKTFLSIILLPIFFYILPPGGFSAWTWHSGIRWFYFFALSFFLVLILIPFSIYLAKKTNAIDLPEERKVHNSPIPRLGGFAIWIAFTITIIRSFNFDKEIIFLLMGSSLIYILGAIDDIKKLKASTRLIFQFLAAFLVVYGGIRISFFSTFGFWGEILSYIISIFWILTITNSFNFMDGIDGLASVMSLICSLLFLFIVINSKQYEMIVFSAALSGASLSFLIFNWYPAKVFLGDGGSTFIGFILSCMAIYGTWTENNILASISMPIMILGIPIFDLFYTTVSRIKNGKVKNIVQWLEYAGKDHLHHRLLKIGLKVKGSVLFIGILNLILGIGAVLIVTENKNYETLMIIAQSVLVFFIIVMLMLTLRENKEVENGKN